MSAKSVNKTKIALFGSAFNPPSLGHKSVVESLSHFDKVILLPSIAHAWGKEMAGYEVRCKMVELFIKDLNLPNTELSRLEQQLVRPGKSVTTFAVLEALEEEHQDAEITFVIGPDNFLKFSNFYKCKEILSRWSVLACPETVPVRSTHIRDNLQKMRSVAKMTTPLVEKFLIDNSVY